MEFIQLCLQLKSLVGQTVLMSSESLLSQLSRDLSLNSFQVDGVYADSMIVLAYLILLISKTNAARVKILTAFLCTFVIAYTPVYAAISDVGYHCALAMIYIAAHRRIDNKQIKHTIVIMTLFQLFMAIDSYANPQIETWLYRNFEEITILIHALIVSSCINFKPIDLGAVLGRFIDSLRSLAHSNCLTSRL